MGSIKSTKATGEHPLTEQEFAFIEMLNQMKNQYVEDMNHRISSVLNNIAKTRLSYPEKADLQFELDFSDTTRTLKVTRL